MLGVHTHFYRTSSCHNSGWLISWLNALSVWSHSLTRMQEHCHTATCPEGSEGRATAVHPSLRMHTTTLLYPDGSRACMMLWGQHVQRKWLPAACGSICKPSWCASPPPRSWLQQMPTPQHHLRPVSFTTDSSVAVLAVPAGQRHANLVMSEMHEMSVTSAGQTTHVCL
jgi:hypothetical protein